MNSLFRWPNGIRNKTSCILFVLLTWEVLCIQSVDNILYAHRITSCYGDQRNSLVRRSFAWVWVNTIERKRKGKAILLDYYYYFVLLYSWTKEHGGNGRGAVMRNWLKRHRKEHINIFVDWAEMLEMGSKQFIRSFWCIKNWIIFGVRAQTLVYIMLNWKLWCCTVTLDQFSPK